MPHSVGVRRNTCSGSLYTREFLWSSMCCRSQLLSATDRESIALPPWGCTGPLWAVLAAVSTPKALMQQEVTTRNRAGGLGFRV